MQAAGAGRRLFRILDVGTLAALLRVGHHHAHAAAQRRVEGAERSRWCHRACRRAASVAANAREGGYATGRSGEGEGRGGVGGGRRTEEKREEGVWMGQTRGGTSSCLKRGERAQAGSGNELHAPPRRRPLRPSPKGSPAPTLWAASRPGGAATGGMQGCVFRLGECRDVSSASRTAP